MEKEEELLSQLGLIANKFGARIQAILVSMRTKMMCLLAEDRGRKKPFFLGVRKVKCKGDSNVINFRVGVEKD